MTHVSIIGTGSMGNAIGGVLAGGGGTVDYITHDDLAHTTPTPNLKGDIVVLAVPHPAIAEVLAEVGDQLAGKTVVDITNPVNFETFNSLVVSPGSSKAAEIQAALPNSNVVKAFNTNFAATLATKQVGGNPTTVLVAGDNATAKSALAAAITAGGVKAVDAGSLQRAAELEALGFLQLTLAASEKIAWTDGFALV